MLKPIAVEGMTLTITPNTVSGTVSVVGMPSSRARAAGAAVYRGPVNVSIETPTQGDFVGPLASGALQPTAAKGRADGMVVLREGDRTAELTVTGTHTSTGATTPIVFTVVVSAAGQTKNRSE